MEREEFIILGLLAKSVDGGWCAINETENAVNVTKLGHWIQFLKMCVCINKTLKTYHVFKGEDSEVCTYIRRAIYICIIVRATH